MSDIAIRVEGVSKRYRIRPREGYLALRDVLAWSWRLPFRWLAGSAGQVASNPVHDGWIWALRDVSFQVRQGEVVGIIGRNGAGKTTLLKILARITRPTMGYARVVGRVGSLLEVGTGFHPELTGRENIYLSGAVLGMTKKEIDRKFDEIVAFAETERFVDTPVKYYSSGMFVRLAFAVAAYLEPEILLVDEVLAVGDAAFQSKCLGKMGKVTDEGRAVLFVSHNMGAIRALCRRGAVLHNGHLVYSGSGEEAVRLYLAQWAQVDRAGSISAFVSLEGKRRRVTPSLARLQWVRLSDPSGRPKTIFGFDEGMRIAIGFEVRDQLRVGIHAALKASTGEPIALFSTLFHRLDVAAKGRENEAELFIPRIPLASGRYIVDLVLYIPYVENLDYVEDACFFDVEISSPAAAGLAYEQRLGLGHVYIDHSWRLPGINGRG